MAAAAETSARRIAALPAQRGGSGGLGGGGPAERAEEAAYAELFAFEKVDT